jgi:adenylyltransferase/sulfurtransferase
VLKEILGIGQSMSGRLLVWDALDARFRTIKLKPDPACALCGPHSTIKDLSAHGVPEGPACAV